MIIKNMYLQLLTFLIVVIIIFLGYNAWKYNNEINNVKEKINITTNIKEAYFAAGCFWCAESSFEKYKKNGIIEVISGYAGGKIKNPSYKDVLKGDTGHREAIKVLYDPNSITYSDLLEIFWRTADPTDDGGQYVDRGFQYTSAIFYLNDNEKELSISSKEKLKNSRVFADEKIITPIIQYINFYKAEDYHQDYYIKNPIRYNLYTSNSGRKEFLEKFWGDDLYLKFKNKLKIMNNYKGEPLTKLQYNVTMEKGTEKPFDNKYWDNKKQGIYVDIISGETLYSSIDKYVSGTGWPSFTKPININNVSEKEDKGLFSTRTEIIGTKSKAHIGHVFSDGPADKGGFRYCMNSASMIFIAKEDLEKEGYGKYLSLF